MRGLIVSIIRTFVLYVKSDLGIAGEMKCQGHGQRTPDWRFAASSYGPTWIDWISASSVSRLGVYSCG
jgi:hypothetical protein